MYKPSNRTMVIAGALTLPVAIGGLLGMRSMHKTDSKRAATFLSATRAETGSKPYMLDMQLHEHAALATAALQAELLGLPSAADAASALDNNSQSIADSIAQLYPGIRNQFLQLWRSHIDDYKQYQLAASTNNHESKERAMGDLAQFVDKLTALLTKVNPRINKDDLTRQLTIHSDQSLAIVDALVDQDYASAYDLSSEAYSHMFKVAEAIAPEYNP